MIEPEELKDTNDVLTEKERLNALLDYDEDSVLAELDKQKFDDSLGDGFDTSDVSDGYHTFGELYHHRAVLFAVIVNMNKGLAFKSKLHEDGTMFDDMFIVGIKTPKGWYTYHYEMEEWPMFKCKEWARAPKWDGHTPDDVERLLSLVKPSDKDGALNGALDAGMLSMRAMTHSEHAKAHNPNVASNAVGNYTITLDGTDVANKVDEKIKSWGEALGIAMRNDNLRGM